MNQFKWLEGRRVEIPVHCDNWMRGDRFGRVTSVRLVKGVGIARVQGERATITRLPVEELMQYGRIE